MGLTAALEVRAHRTVGEETRMRSPVPIVAVAASPAACSAPAPSAPAGNRRPTPPPAAPARPASLQALLDAELPGIPARSGIWVKHLKTGEEGAVSMPTRSSTAPA